MLVMSITGKDETLSRKINGVWKQFTLKTDKGTELPDEWAESLIKGNKKKFAPYQEGQKQPPAYQLPDRKELSDEETTPMDRLFEIAKDMGIKYSPNIGREKLIERIFE